MFQRPVFWAAFTVFALACTTFAILNVPRAFSIVELDLQMDRETAMSEAGRLAEQFGWGPSDYRQAASFRVDDRVRSFVELEAGGAETFAGLMRDGPYYPYQWVVRNFRSDEVREVAVWFRPDGTPYGYREQLSEDTPGAALGAGAARTIAENSVGAPWNVALDSYDAVESSQKEQPGGRIDHTFVYERKDVRAGEGRFRLRIVVSGDRTTEITHLLQVPEAFDRRHEQMRSANTGIAIGGTFAMILLYGVGGIGVALFVLLRQRWVLWRSPLVWGAGASLIQLLAGLNQWPLIWMGYDTALSESSFAVRQLTTLVAGFFAFTAVFTLSFMAAESLSRRAFPHHVQFWSCWSRDGARSRQVLGQTVAGYLMVGVDLAFVVAFYWIAKEYLGWWSPSDALLDPNSLATVLPWLGPLAISLQAGFWEECLFRAIPLAGAALLGNRFGNRRVWIGGAFVVQILIFGAAHAAYPTQPAYARLIELIVPSTVFGLLYLRFGLLPVIVMHFTFDAVLFALPLFASSAPGVWVDQGLFVLILLTPLWIVLSARLRGGRWIDARTALLNRTWRPPDPEIGESPTIAMPRERLDLPRLPVVAGIAAVGFGLWAYAAATPSESPSLEVGRSRSLEVARGALAAQGVDTEDWTELSVVVGRLDAADRFVWSESGAERYRTLLGEYLPEPRWRVRYARFEGDVAARAEEHIVWVGADGKLARREHRLAEGTAGLELSEENARSLARTALGPPDRAASLREVSAESSSLPERTDWTFTFRDEKIADLEGGEPRVAVELAGDEIVDTRRYFHLPEEWRRSEDQRRETLSIAFTLSSIMLGLVLLAGTAGAVIRWTRGQFNVRAGLEIGVLAFTVSVLSLANDWPTFMNATSTAQPLPLQIGISLVGGLVGGGIAATVLGLLAGLTHALAAGRHPSSRVIAVCTGLALGLGFLGSMALVGIVFGSSLPDWSAYGPASSVVPLLGAALDRVAQYLMLTLGALLVITSVNVLTEQWARRRVMGAALLMLVGMLLAPGKVPEDVISWMISGLVGGVFLLAAYAWVLRSRPALVVFATAAMIVPGLIGSGLDQAYASALAGSLIGAIVISLLFWRWFETLTRTN